MVDIGMKTPEIKISGSLTVLRIDITSPTFSVGYAANSVPSVAKQKAVRIIEIARMGAFTMDVPNTITPIARGKHAIPRL